MTKPRPWSPEDEKLLLEMRAAGAKWRKMADTLDRTVAACEGRLAKLLNTRTAVSDTPVGASEAEQT
jgi:hypothetical protein